MANSSDTSAGPVPVSGATVSKKESKPERTKPTRTLPTDRINPAKQLDILRAYAAASGKGLRAVAVSEIAEIMKMAVSTLSMTHPFFTSIGLLERADTGTHAVSADVIAFLNAHEWNPEKASYKLAPAFRDSWCGEALVARVTFAPIDEDAAIQVLAEACSAAPEYRNQLRTLLDLMAACGVVERDGGLVKAAKAKQASKSEPEKTAPESSAKTPEPQQRGKIATTFAKAPEGGVQFNVNVHVDMSEFANWRPERITAFFGGIAQVLAAKANVERGGSQGS